MSDVFNDFGPVEWFRSQFEDPSAASMFRLVLISWAVAAIVFIALDRLGSMLLGRSMPLAQHPPERARAWRWGRSTPPSTYSLLPPGVEGVPVLEPSIPLARPLALGAGPLPPTIVLPDVSSPLDDAAFWRLFADDLVPIFGFENGARLARGEAPERYNPVSGRVEALERNADEGTLSWPTLVSRDHTVGGNR